MSNLRPELRSLPKGRLRSFLNALALEPVKAAKTERPCDLCTCPIMPGQSYRYGGPKKSVHNDCFLAVNREVK